MRVKEFLLNLQKGMAEGRVSVPDALQMAHRLLSNEGIPCNDIYESIDMLENLVNPETKEHVNKSSIHEIPESVIRHRRQTAIRDSASNIIRIACGNNRNINYHQSLKYWSGKRVTVFYDPVMVGFASSEELPLLGWGSVHTASKIAKYCYLETNNNILNYKRTAIILTRHSSKYAHFIRDRLTKIIWAQYISNMGPFDDYIFDYPLTEKELKCLHDLGVKANFHYANQLGRIFTLECEFIIVIEVSSGLNLLPLLKDYMMKKVINPIERSKVYLSRGQQGSRRDACNAIQVEETVTKLGYTVLELSDLSYIEQLNYCAGAGICTGIHGAQLINSILGCSLIEIHSFPYCTSPWSETMLKMSRVLDIPYVPILLTSTDKHSSITNCENSKIKDIYKARKLSKNNPETSQTSEFSINIENLTLSINIAESLAKKL